MASHRRSISFYILVPLMVTVGVVLLMGGCFFGYQAYMLREQTYANIDRTLRKAEELFAQRRAAFTAAANQVNERLDWLLFEQKHGGDMDLSSELTRIVMTQGFNGYLFRAPDGSTTGSYDNPDETQIDRIVAQTRDAGVLISIGRPLVGPLCNFCAVALRSDEQDDIGTVLFVGVNFGDSKSLQAYRQQVEMDFYLFDSDGCQASSVEHARLTGLALDTLAADKAYKGPTEMFGDLDFIGTMPLASADGEQRATLAVRADTTQMRQILSGLALAVGICLVVITSIIIFEVLFLRRRIVRPIKQLEQSLAHIAEGDMTRKVHLAKTCREIDDLSMSMAQTERRIRDVLLPLERAALELDESSGKLRQAGQDMADNANRQAAALEEIASSMSQMEGNIKQNSENSLEASRLAVEMRVSSDALAVAALAAGTGMQRVADTIESINDLVSQTNILALNASVESARAGEAGQGFGVVAREVGRLADQTAQTAGSIADITQQSVEATGTAQDRFKELDPNITRVTDMVKAISAASAEQTQGVQQITTAVDDLNQVTQTNAASAEHVNLAIQQLANIVGAVRECMGHFKIH